MNTGELAFGWLYFAVELFLLPSVLTDLNGLLPKPLSAAWINTVFYLVNFIAVVTIFRDFLLRSLRSLGKKFGQYLKAVVLGFVAYWAATRLLSWLLGLVPGFVNVNDSAISAMANDHFWIMAVGTVLLVPVVEELLYRGLIFLGLYPRNRVAAYVISVAAFAAVHVIGHLGSASPLILALCFLQYIPAGLCLAWAYAESDSIFAPILIHMVVNLVGIFSLR